MGTHMPCGITQCYLPPGRGDIPAFTTAEACTRFSDVQRARLAFADDSEINVFFK